MNQERRIVLFSTVLVTLAGCATVPDGPTYPAGRAATQPGDRSLVYVYRRHAEPTAWGANIQFSGRDVATLSQGTYTWAFVSPGKQTVRAVWPGMSGQRDSTIEAQLEPGKAYYFELVGTSRVSGVVGSAVLFRMGSGLNEVAATAAEQVLTQCCRLQKASAENY